jgi:3-oxoacyl-[acyl-carrier protein] reductase
MRPLVLITGASRGIGRAAARQFAAGGYAVAINYHEQAEAAQDLVRELADAGYPAMAIGADVSDRRQVDGMIDQARRAFGPVDVLINNAGFASQQLFGEITEQDWDRMFAVHVKGTFHCCQAVLPEMIRRQSGKIINVSSIWGMTGASCEVAYSAAKAAVIGLTRALAKELGPAQIQVNCIAPGVINTDMLDDLSDQDRLALVGQTPLGRLGTAADIAGVMLFLASGAASYITGQVISPNGGFVI